MCRKASLKISPPTFSENPNLKEKKDLALGFEKVNQKRKRCFLILFLLLPMVLVVAMTSGSAITRSEVFQYCSGNKISLSSQIILEKIRIPRIIFAFFIGASLATAGGSLQSLLRNPLAEPYTLGISGGAAFGVTLGMFLRVYSNFPMELLPFSGFLGALLSSSLVHLLAKRKKFSSHTLILGGVIIGFLFSSLLILLLLFLPPQISQNTLFLLVGDLSAIDSDLLLGSVLILSFCVLYLCFRSPTLNILTLGEEKAKTLGVLPSKITKEVFWITSIIAGICVSIGGMIGFIGLMVPHLFRMFIGSNLIFLLPASAIGGGIILILSDTLARSIFFPIEIPVGVVTGIIGGTFFLITILSKENF